MQYTILDKTYNILDFSRSDDKIFEVNFDNNNFTNKGILKIKANYES